MNDNPCWILIPLRIGQIGSAATVVGLIASGWHHAYYKTPFAPIYTLTIAALSMLLALLCLTPFTRAFRAYTDYILSVLWIIAFGILLGLPGYCLLAYEPPSCNKKRKAATAFSCLSSLFWFATAVFEIWYMRRFLATEPLTVDAQPGVRQKWYKRSKV